MNDGFDGTIAYLKSNAAYIRDEAEAGDTAAQEVMDAYDVWFKDKKNPHKRGVLIGSVSAYLQDRRETPDA